MLWNLVRPILNGVKPSLANPTQIMTPLVSSIRSQPPSTIATTRTLLKTHKGAAKRWRKMGNGGYKRGKACHNHGNVDWSRSVVNSVSGTAYAKGKGYGNHIKKLKRLLPYA